MTESGYVCVLSIDANSRITYYTTMNGNYVLLARNLRRAKHITASFGEGQMLPCFKSRCDITQCYGIRVGFFRDRCSSFVLRSSGYFHENTFISNCVFPVCKDLILKFLTPNPCKRTTLHQAMQHPWIKEGICVTLL